MSDVLDITAANVGSSRGWAERWVTGRFPSFARACLVGGLFLAPNAVLRTAESQFGSPKLAIVWMAALGAATCWIVSSLYRRRWMPSSGLAWAGTAFAGVTALATLFSLSPALSLVGVSERNNGLVSIVAYLATMMAMIGLYWEEPRRLRSLLWAVGLGAVVVAISVLLEQAGVERVFWPGPLSGSPWPYPNGLMGNSNFTGALLGIALPSLWFLALTADHRLARLAAGGGIGVVVVALCYTQTRGGLLAAMAGIVVMAVARGRTRRGWIRPLLAATTVGALTVSGFLVLRQPQPTATQSVAGVEALRTNTLRYRLNYWKGAIVNVAHHPLLGTGPDTFYAYYPLYRPAADGATAKASDQGTLDTPHNIFLAHASDSGILGLGSYLVLVGLAFRYGSHRLRQLAGHDRALLAAFLGTFAAYLTQGFFSIDIPNLAWLGWVALGAIAVLADPRVVRARDAQTVRVARATADISAGLSAPAPPKQHRRWPAPALLACTALALAYLCFRPLQADVAMHEGHVDEAIRLNPLESSYRLNVGTSALFQGASTADPVEKMRLLSRAEVLYRQELRLAPFDIDTMVRMANLEATWASSFDPGRFNDADAWWRKVLARDPRNQYLRHTYETDLPAAERLTVVRLQGDIDARPQEVGPRIDLAKTYLALRDKDSATEVLAGALRLDPSNAEAKTLLIDLPTPPKG
jgi:O-antigen ligase